MKKIIKIISVVLGVVLVIGSVLVWREYRKIPLDFEKIRSQIYAYEIKMADLRMAEIDSEASDAFQNLNSDGSFPDIDYTDTAQTNWKPAGHLTRLRSLVLSYVNPAGKYYKDSEAYEKIVSGLSFWQEAKPVSTNWYMQEISSPQNVGAMLVLMRFGEEKVPSELENAMLLRMKETGGDPKKWTGANKTDISVHYIYRGALTEDSRLIKKGAEEAFSTLFFTTKEGFQIDGSYQQHGPQLYITGYGNAIVNSLAAVITAVEDTPYAITEEQLEPLRRFITESYMRVTRGSCRMYNSGGRSLSRENSLDVSGDVLLYEKMKCIDRRNANSYDEAISQLKGGSNGFSESKNTHFWRSDYSLHTAPDYSFDVRTVSDRTARNENGNDENLKGYFLADGAYSITVKGNEYFNIFPLWDYAMIPGTTAPYIKDIPLPEPWGTLGKSSFAGGLSDGRTGVCAYAYSDNDFSLSAKANKSYFMLGDCIVCLGSGIKGENDAEMRTTLNQTLSDGEVYLIDNYGKASLFNESEAALDDTVKGVYHNNVGYVFCDSTPKFLMNKNQSGKWTDINASQSNNETVTGKVFTLYENHGVKPESGSYQYIILPGIESEKEVESFDRSSIEILSNSEIVQAVGKAGSDEAYAVFFAAGSLEYGDIRVSVDKPCILKLDFKQNKLYASNPDQSVKKVTVVCQRGDTVNKRTVKLYSGKSEFAGKTVECEF